VISELGDASDLGKKLAGHLPLSDRPFAFLVTPKLPLGGRRCKSVVAKEADKISFVNIKLSKSFSNILKNIKMNNLKKA
jgi:hypothetical protein